MAAAARFHPASIGCYAPAMKVDEVLRLLTEDGWVLVATRGSHRQYKHPSKPGRVTVPGKPRDDLAPGTLNSVLKQAGLKNEVAMRYAVVIEQADNNYSAYVPDLPGCVATAATLDQVEMQIREAIAFHLEGLREDGTPIPQPSSRVEYVEVAA
jgi:predicted RNA binding protein YcfA (HicA-like mRNA interferase family)/predicted RNase H-like HicB family nuclease